jgi:hypothetical protein
MNISSAQQDYSITSSDTITIDLSKVTGAGSSCTTDTITLTGGGSSYTIGGFTGATGSWNYTSGAGLNTGAIGTISITDIANEYANQEEFVNCLPDFSRIEAMCKEYPGLMIAYEKFKTTYRLVKDDYDTPKDKRKVP